MDFVVDMLRESWHLLLDAGVYILFGLLVQRTFRVFSARTRMAGISGTAAFRPCSRPRCLGFPSRFEVAGC